MRALSGLLRLDTKYKVIQYSYSDMEYLTQCQNCGHIIANTATVENLEGQRFTIGQDCAEKIITLDGSNRWQAIQIKKEFNRKKSLLNKIKKSLKNGTVKNDGTFITFYNADGIWSSRYFIRHVEKIIDIFNFNINSIPRSIK